MVATSSYKSLPEVAMNAFGPLPEGLAMRQAKAEEAPLEWGGKRRATVRKDGGWWTEEEEWCLEGER